MCAGLASFPPAAYPRGVVATVLADQNGETATVVLRPEPLSNEAEREQRAVCSGLCWRQVRQIFRAGLESPDGDREIPATDHPDL
jgi:hypothetical protein